MDMEKTEIKLKLETCGVRNIFRSQGQMKRFELSKIITGYPVTEPFGLFKLPVSLKGLKGGSNDHVTYSFGWIWRI